MAKVKKERVEWGWEGLKRDADLKEIAFSCVSETGKTRCKELDGTCMIQRDGYYTVGTVCVIFGFLLLLGYIKRVVQHLEGLSKQAWRISR